jgi:hypothetical protein
MIPELRPLAEGPASLLPEETGQTAPASAPLGVDAGDLLGEMVDPVRLRVISLGAGVQSTTMALMAAHGEIGPMPDCAIFADTGDEKRATYRHLDWLESVLPFPLVRVRRFDVSLAVHTLGRFATGEGGKFTPPLYSDNPRGMLPTQCSKEFKTRAIIKECRTRIGLAPGQRGPKSVSVEVWIGMTRDEADRMKPAEPPWMQNRWPLIEKDMRRGHCPAWLIAHGYPVPVKSACVYCPWHDDAQWIAMEANRLDDDWSRALAFDIGVRTGVGMDGEFYVHRSRKPLGDVTFDRSGEAQIDLFHNECEGMCGV